MIDVGELERLMDTTDESMSVYRTSCDCYSEEHVMTIFLENYDGIKDATFYYKTNIKGSYIERNYGDTWSEYFCNLLKFLWSTCTYRIKSAIKILFTGNIELEGGFVFRNDKQILAIAEALIELVNSDQRK